MPDSTTLDMGGAGDGATKSIPGWVMIVGAVAGVVGLVFLVKGQGGGGTTAAGTSINAALGSIQEENMNLLGTTQAGFMQTSQQYASLSNQMGAGFSSTGQAITDTQNLMNAGFAAQAQQIQGGFSGVQQQLTAGFGQTQQGFTDTQNLISASQGATSSQLQNIFNSLTGQLANNQAISNEQYGQLVAIQTNPWVKQFYENQVAGNSNLTPEQQGYFWQAVENMAMYGHQAGAGIGSY